MESGYAQPWFYGMSQAFSISRNHPYTTRDLRPTQHRGQLLLAARMGDALDHPGDAQRRVIEEAEGTHDLLERPPRHMLLLDEVELVSAHVLRPEMLGRGVKVPRKLSDTAQIRAHSMLRVVAELEIVTHPLA